MYESQVNFNNWIYFYIHFKVSLYIPNNYFFLNLISYIKIIIEYNLESYDNVSKYPKQNIYKGIKRLNNINYSTMGLLLVYYYIYENFEASSFERDLWNSYMDALKPQGVVYILTCLLLT